MIDRLNLLGVMYLFHSPFVIKREFLMVLLFLMFLSMLRRLVASGPRRLSLFVDSMR